MTAQVDAFRLAATVLDEAGVLWWLSDGAVLGAVRDGRFVATDPDVDLGVWAADMPTVRAALADTGWKVTRDRPGQVWAIHDGVKIDVHGHVRAGDRVRYELARGRLAYQYPANLFDAFAPATFHGVATRTPDPAEAYLTAHYGPDWRTPRARWRWDVDPPCLIRL